LSKRSAQNYRLFPLFIASLLLFAAISALLIFGWAAVSYLLKAPAEGTGSISDIFWLLALVLSVLIMTRLTRGGTVLPALLLSFVTVIVSSFFATPELVSAGSIVSKLLISLAAAIIAFILGKLYVLKCCRYPAKRSKAKAPRRRPKQQKQQVNSDQAVLIQVDDEDLLGFSEPKDE